MVAGGAAFWGCQDCTARHPHVKLLNCEFSDNYAELSSGDVSTHYFEFNATDCVFNGQETDGYAGVMYAYGSTIVLLDSTVSNTHNLLSVAVWLEHSYASVLDTEFIHNLAIYGHGSGLYVSDIVELVILDNEIIPNTTVIEIDNCLFYKNAAYYDGGELYINSDCDTSDLKYSPSNNSETSNCATNYHTYRQSIYNSNHAATRSNNNPTHSPTDEPSDHPSTSPTYKPTFYPTVTPTGCH